MTETNQVDLTGLKCPMPIVELTKFMRPLEIGDTITAIANDPAFCLDVEAGCTNLSKLMI
ncbi:MAG TPA: sulfurtransferase TusA family protein [Verrucomicrobiales bacterium]|nr:sulfurtransferase TusA family protein [Verrucomicrobiales bacterium]